MGSNRLRRETIVSFSWFLLPVVALAVYLPHLIHGGFYADDWGVRFIYHFSPPPHFTNAVNVLHALDPRPLLPYFKVLETVAAGSHPVYNHLISLVLAVVLAVLVYRLLLRLGLRHGLALGAAVLGLLFPWSDSLRLWGTAGLNQIAVIFFLVGLLLALRGLDFAGLRGAGWHALALAAFTISMLTYETAAALIPFAGAVYLVKAPSRTARRLAIVDLLFGIALVALTYELHSHGRVRTSAGGALKDLGPTMRQLVSLGSRAIDPVWGHALLVVLVVGLVSLARLVWLHVFAGDDRDLREVCLGLAAAGLACVLAGLPLAGSGLHPLDPGLSNRGNLMTTVPLVIFAVLFVKLVVNAWLPFGRLRGIGMLALVAAIALVYIVDVRRDIADWDRASVMQNQVLSLAGRVLPSPRTGSFIFLVGAPATTAPNVPVFPQPWTLTDALSIRYNRFIHGIPVFVPGRLVCTATTLYPSAPPALFDLSRGEGPAMGTPFRNGFILDLRDSELRAPRDRASCWRQVAAAQPGPVLGR